MSINQIHICVVDDEQHTRKTLTLILTAEGHRITTAQNGFEAIEIISSCQHQDPVELLLLDLEMPEKGGIEVLEELTKMNIEMPTVAISGFSTSETVDEAKMNGCSLFLDKPFSPDDVVKTVNQLIGTIV